MNASEALEDVLIGRDIDIMRLEAELQRSTLAELRKLEKDLQAALRATDPTGPRYLGAQMRRLTRFLDEVRDQIRRVYGGIARDLERQEEEAIEIESDYLGEVFAGVVGFNLIRRGIRKRRAKEMVQDQLVQGAAPKEHWKRQGSNLLRRLGDQLRQGVQQAESITQLVARAIGTRAQNFANGLMRVSEREAESLIQTSLSQVITGTRDELYGEMKDLLSGRQAINPLDFRTSTICRARAGRAWRMNGAPFPGTGTVERFPGPPPWHFRCRTTLIPIIRSYKQLLDSGALSESQHQQLLDMAEAKKVALDGKPATGVTFDTWFNRLSKEEQRKAVGPGRLELWEKGAIRATDLIDQRGRPLTLEQLRSKNSK